MSRDPNLIGIINATGVSGLADNYLEPDFNTKDTDTKCQTAPRPALRQAAGGPAPWAVCWLIGAVMLASIMRKPDAESKH